MTCLDLTALRLICWWGFVCWCVGPDVDQCVRRVLAYWSVIACGYGLRWPSRRPYILWCSLTFMAALVGDEMIVFSDWPSCLSCYSSQPWFVELHGGLVSCDVQLHRWSSSVWPSRWSCCSSRLWFVGLHGGFVSWYVQLHCWSWYGGGVRPVGIWCCGGLSLVGILALFSSASSASWLHQKETWNHFVVVVELDMVLSWPQPHGHLGLVVASAPLAYWLYVFLSCYWMDLSVLDAILRPLSFAHWSH